MSDKKTMNSTLPAPSAEEIVAYLVQSGTISLDGVKNAMENTERQKILENHPYSISQGSDGRWRTWVKDAKAKGGRRKIAKATREKLEDALYDFYIGHDEAEIRRRMTIRKLYPDWIKFKALHTDAETYIERIQSDWKKYYANDPIVDKPIRQLKKIELDEWVHKLIQDNNLTKNAYYNITIIMRQCLQYAVELDIIPESPFDKVQVDTRRGFRTVHKKKSETQVYTPDEVRQLFQAAWDNFYFSTRLQYRLAPLAVIFQFLTGLRVGELCVIKFSDIETGRLTVSRMLRRDTGEIVDHTKTHEDRTLLLPDAAIELVHIAKTYQQLNDGSGIYIFSMTDEPLAYGEVNELLKRYCARAEIPYRSSHKARKTYISSLIDAGINIDTIRSYVGHADERTTYFNYCYDRMPDPEKKKILDAALTG